MWEGPARLWAISIKNLITEQTERCKISWRLEVLTILWMLINYTRYAQNTETWEASHAGSNWCFWWREHRLFKMFVLALHPAKFSSSKGQLSWLVLDSKQDEQLSLDAVHPVIQCGAWEIHHSSRQAGPPQAWPQTDRSSGHVRCASTQPWHKRINIQLHQRKFYHYPWDSRPLRNLVNLEMHCGTSKNISASQQQTRNTNVFE